MGSQETCSNREISVNSSSAGSGGSSTSTVSQSVSISLFASWKYLKYSLVYICLVEIETGYVLDALQVFDVLHLVVSLGIILAMDKFLKQAFAAAAIKFPSALFGMFCIFSILVILDSTVPAAATSLMNFFEPALLFIQRWLPLFYVPSLVVLPLSVQDIPAASGIKICYIVGNNCFFHWLIYHIFADEAIINY